MPTITKLSWEQFEKDVQVLCDVIKQDPRSTNFDHLLIITRGGLIPGYFVAQSLGIKKIKTVCVQSYSSNRSQNSEIQHLRISGFKEHIQEPEKWLIVDEIADSGKSLQFVKQMFPHVLTACLYTKNTEFCDFYSKVLTPDAWIDFPWEEYDDSDQ